MKTFRYSVLYGVLANYVSLLYGLGLPDLLSLDEDTPCFRNSILE